MNQTEDTPFAQIFNQPLTLWMQGFARLQSESIRFCAARAAKDLRMASTLAACATPADALATATSLAFEAARDYVEHSRKLIEIAAGDFESVAAAVI